jgi:hypothetical protein
LEGLPNLLDKAPYPVVTKGSDQSQLLNSQVCSEKKFFHSSLVRVRLEIFMFLSNPAKNAYSC